MMISLLACAHTVPLPLGAPPADGPVWPAPPDPPRVAWVGAIGAPGRPLDVGCGGGRLAIVDAERSIRVIDAVRSRDERPRGGPRAPIGASIEPDGTVWAVDAAAGALFRLDPGGRAWSPVRVDLPLSRPTAVVRRDEQHLAVVETGAHRVSTVDLGTGGVQPLGGRGEIGVGFNFPLDVVARDGELWVVDGMNAAVQAIADGPPRQLVRATFVRPKGLAVDHLGRLHVVDGGMQHVQVYDPATGAWLGRYGQPGDGPGELALPSGICIDGDRVYVADSLNQRIQVFALLGDAP